MSSGCRDCSACSRPAVWRLMIALCWKWWGWMFTMFLPRCPQCKHAKGRHARRRDGSYMD